MAQPKNRQRRFGDESPEKSAERKERENLEKKADMFVQKRNELNDRARQLREERDLLNGKRQELMGKMDEIKKERDGHNANLREHKEKRNAYQQQAKLLIAKQRGEKKNKEPGKESAVFQAKRLESEIRDMEYDQQTTVLTTKQENKLIETIRKKRIELTALAREAEKIRLQSVDLRNSSDAIDQLFKLADAEHQEVVKYYKLAQAAHEQFMKVFQETSMIMATANAKHAEFIETRNKSDEQHQEFLKLREKMLELRGKEFAEKNEARQIIREQRDQVRKAIADPQKLDEHADDVLEQLKKGGRIKLG
jgi:phosphoserine phosphatase